MTDHVKTTPPPLRHLVSATGLPSRWPTELSHGERWQERAYQKRGGAVSSESSSPPASVASPGHSCSFALDKLEEPRGIKQAIIVVPERFYRVRPSRNTPLSKYGFFWADWTGRPQWNPVQRRPAQDDPKVAKGKVARLRRSSPRKTGFGSFCTHATFRFAVRRGWASRGFDDSAVAVDEFHHVSAHPDKQAGGSSPEGSSWRAIKATSSP